MCPRDYSLIGYRWRNLLYFDKYFPMGLVSATFVAQSVTNAIVYAHSRFGFWSLNYLDDFGSCEKQQDAWSSYNLMGRILQSIGVKEAEEKSVPPTTRMKFLGNTLDTVKMTIEVSEHRKEELTQLLKTWKKKITFMKKQIQSLIEKLSFVTNCVKPGRIFLSRLIDTMKSSDETGRNEVNQQMLKDIQWWLDFLLSFSRISILWLNDGLPVDEDLASDASLIGGGGGGQYIINSSFM